MGLRSVNLILKIILPVHTRIYGTVMLFGRRSVDGELSLASIGGITGLSNKAGNISVKMAVIIVSCSTKSKKVTTCSGRITNEKF